MESEANLFENLKTKRHKCVACFKQYKLKDHLVQHMMKAFHSVHEPKCGVCRKHCKSFESLREHIAGPLSKADCSRIFSERGCKFCLEIFSSPISLREHEEFCCLPAPSPLGTNKLTYTGREFDFLIESNEDSIGTGRPEAIAIDCEMVGGGSDGSLDLCARVCLVDEDEKLIFHAYVLPQIPVTNYRSEITGITEEHLGDALPLKEVQEKVLNILYNGESIGKLRLDGGKGRLLVGHNLEHDLECLRINYPDHLLRDTAKYRPLMKTNLVSHSLKYLTRTYLRCDIQSGVHDPYEDCVSVMRLYKRMRSQCHPIVCTTKGDQFIGEFSNPYQSFDHTELQEMSPDELYEKSKSNYKCWCVDKGITLDN